VRQDWHPILFVFGDQTRGASHWAGLEFQSGIAYQEFIVVLPFVTHRRGGDTAVYAAGMYSSFAPSNWVGSVGYGYNKRPGALERRASIHALTTRDEGLVFQASVESSGPWCRPAGGASEAMDTLRRIAALPWLGRKPNGLVVRSRARWDVRRAMVRPVEARIVAHRPVAPGLPAGAFETVRGASVEIRGMDWWLDFPRSCNA
jgi:hypothetical protein